MKSFKEKKGYLYIITNKAWPGYVKVGVTMDLKKRLQTYQTASPFRDYELMYSIHHPKYLEAETRIKETMKYFATEIRNEWFQVPDLQTAKTRLNEELDDYNAGEY
jgi:predicted GIY-YIG superfamily endonuclease